MNNFICILIIISTNFSLLGKKSTSNKPTDINKNESESSIENLPPLKITPLTDPQIDDLINLAKTPEDCVSVTPPQKNPNQVESYIKTPQWIFESSIENAPELLKSIFFYLRSRNKSINRSERFITIPSFHRLILVGAPGTGKTTLARSIGHMLNYAVTFVPATSFLGNFRNQTARNIQRFLLEEIADGLPKVIIIDELHKLFESYTNDNSDDSLSAAAFWLILDHIEKHNPNVIVIGTANSVDKLPPEIRSRFSGKIITMPLLDKNQTIQAFKNSIMHDESILIDSSVTDEFISQMLRSLNSSLRDIQLIIDSAKIFYYGEKSGHITDFPIILNRNHFQRAIEQLQKEVKVLEGNFADKLCKKLQPWGVVFGIAANICILLKASIDVLSNESIKNYFRKLHC